MDLKTSYVELKTLEDSRDAKLETIQSIQDVIWTMQEELEVTKASVCQTSSKIESIKVKDAFPLFEM